MFSVKSVVCAAMALGISAAAHAADMPMQMPPQVPPQYQPLPTIVEAPAGRWYLRGDVGVGMQSFSQFNYTETNASFVWPASWTIVQQNVSDAALFGFGLGYEFNSWLRFDVTGEYRTQAAFKATGRYTEFCPGGGYCFDVTSGNYSSAVFLANAYLDLGTWWCLTPYVGFGLGGAYNMTNGMQDLGLQNSGSPGFGLGGSQSNLNFAWDVQLGLTYNVTDNFKVDLSWRYLNLGSPQTATVQCFNTGSCPGAYYTLRDMTSQDFRIGFRWMFQPVAAAGVMTAVSAPFSAPMVMQQPAPQPYVMQQPVMQQPYPVQPQYQPQPYAPTVLQSRG
jgi:opacity protein-like surface antigen